MLQENLLNQIKQQTRLFFEENTQQDMGVHVIWDAYKATMRGMLMDLNKRHKRQKNAKLQEIVKSLEKKEAELKWRPGKKKLLEQIKRLQNQYDNVINDELYWQLNIRT